MWWDVIDVSATLPGGAPLRLTYRPGEPGSGIHRLNAETTDGGAALRALDIYDSVKGGTLKITGKVKDDEPRRPLRGRLDSSSFRLVNTPFFVRFLSVAALTGLADVLTGEGFYFDGASARFTKTMGKIEVKKFRSAGPSIGLTSSGTIDLDRAEDRPRRRDRAGLCHQQHPRQHPAARRLAAGRSRARGCSPPPTRSAATCRSRRSTSIPGPRSRPASCATSSPRTSTKAARTRHCPRCRAGSHK